MFVVGMFTLLFVFTSYCLMLKAVPIFLVGFCCMALGIYVQKPKIWLVLIVAPLLGVFSQSVYFYPSEPSSVRVKQVYPQRLLVEDQGKLYEMDNYPIGVEEGVLLFADFTIAREEPNTRGVHGKLQYESIQGEKDLVSRLRGVKKLATMKLIEVFGMDHGGLMASLVLGNKDFLNEERAMDMRGLGIMHILSISGFHFALLEKGFKFMGIKKTAPALLLTYALMLHSIPGYRTVLVLLYKVLGKILRRDPEPITGLCLAMILQVCYQPYIIFKVGFLLTYLASLGIVLMQEPFLRALYFLPPILGKSIALTLSALFLTFPFILSFSPDFSLGVFLGNLCMVPLYSIVTYLSFFGIFASGFSWGGFLLQPFVEVFFDLSLHVGHLLSKIPLHIGMAHLSIDYGYVAIALGVLYTRKRRNLMLVVITACLLWGMPFGERILVYNIYGTPKIQVIQNFRKYDIMDYRVAERGDISLRVPVAMKMGQNLVEIIPGHHKKDVPRILIGGKEVHLEERMMYYPGTKRVQQLIFINERVYRVK